MPHDTFSENRVSGQTAFGPRPPEAFLEFYMMFSNGGEVEDVFPLGESPASIFKKMPVPQTSSIHPASILAYKLHTESQSTEQEKQHNNMALQLNT